MTEAEKEQWREEVIQMLSRALTQAILNTGENRPALAGAIRDSFAYGTTTTTPPITIESLRAMVAKIPPPDRRVFCYRGTWAEFKAEMKAAGVIDEPPVPDVLSWPLFGIYCVAEEGRVLIGAWDDVQAVIEGRRSDVITLIAGHIPPQRTQ